MGLHVHLSHSRVLFILSCLGHAYAVIAAVSSYVYLSFCACKHWFLVVIYHHSSALSMSISEMKGCDIILLFQAEHSIVTYSLHFDQSGLGIVGLCANGYY